MKGIYTTFICSALCLAPLPSTVFAAEKTDAPAKAEVSESNNNAVVPPAAMDLDHPGMYERMKFKLGLTKEQKQKIHAIRKAKREKSEAIQEERKAKLTDLQTALKSGTDDDVRKAFAALQATNQKLSELHLEGMLETRTFLTPDQRATFAGMGLHHLGGHHGRGGRK